MTRTRTTLLVALLVVGAFVAAPMPGVAAQSTESTETTAEPTESADDNASVAPGQQFAGVVGVGEAELEGEVEDRAYGIQVAQARTENARADVVADRLADVEERLRTLEERKRALDEARENGSMSEGEYRARMAKVHAETKSAQRLANRTNDTAGELPAELLAEKGINVTALRTLRTKASELSGPETAAIARSIAGNGVGRPAHAGPPDHRSGNASEHRPGAGEDHPGGGPPGGDGYPNGGDHPGGGPPGDGDRDETDEANETDE